MVVQSHVLLWSYFIKGQGAGTKALFYGFDGNHLVNKPFCSDFVHNDNAILKNSRVVPQ